LKRGLVALVVGLLFGMGLTISGMTQPQKIIGFLDVFGNWDPSLAFVMMGAIGVHFFAYRIAKHQTSPLLADTFLVTSNKEIDNKLLVGAAIFGIGWGIAGYCPGPAITSLVSLNSEVFIFVLSMSVGMFFYDFWLKSRN